MRSDVFQIIKAAFAAILASLVFVLAFTFVIQIFSLPADIIKPINQIFKVISVAVGGLIFIGGERGLVKGVSYGAIASLLTFLLYASIAGAFNFAPKFIFEVLLGAVAGGISGVLAVNLKKCA